jgi:hypothetical protein
LISQLGDVHEGTWEFIGNHHLLHIKGTGFNFLLNHGMLFKGVFIIQKQGVFDSFEVLYDEAVVPNGDIVKYIESQLFLIEPHNITPEVKTNPVLDFPFTTVLNGVQITISNEPQIGDKIISDGLFSGKVTGLPKHYGVDIEDNHIVRVFKQAKAHTNSGIIELEVDNLDWDHPAGCGYLPEGKTVSDGNYDPYYLEPNFLNWRRLKFSDGRFVATEKIGIEAVVIFSILAIVLLIIISLAFYSLFSEA